MPKLATLETCTGCAACFNICHVHAIRMIPIGKLGHLHPSIDPMICVECGACERICPILHVVSLKTLSEAYAAWTKNMEDNKASSSGGIATTFAKEVLKIGGAVYGCANKGIDVCHIRIDNMTDIELLRGSKYVQSTIGNILGQVKADLKSGRTVLFIGTPCQIAGLLSYLKRTYENLVTVDLICHGTPSLHLLQQHVLSIASRQQITKISFREGGFYLKLYNGSNLIYCSDLWKQRLHDAYYTTFIEGYTYRESCYRCRYAQSQRCSDITIGDFWGLGEKETFKTDHPNAGISVILPNTEKGKFFFNSVKDAFYVYDRPIEEAIEGNDQLKAPKRKNISIKLFRWLFAKGISLKVALYLTDFYRLPIYSILNRIRK